MTNTTTINASSNPAAANKAVTDALALAEQEVTVNAQKPESMKLPPKTEVDLPGGFMDPIMGLVSTAEVRELTGVDEELISKLSDPGKVLLTILERATVKLGNEPVDKDILDALYAGDREMILLAIRNATFGSEVRVGPGECPHCAAEQTFEIDLVKDVPVKKLEGDREFTVECKVGSVVVALPTGSTQRAIITSTNKTSAELDTILLANCIRSINGQPVINTETVRNLSLKDRRTILNEITNRNPGPQLSLINKPCTSCGQWVPLPLTLAELFL